MLERILRHLRNWFVVGNGIHAGTYTIKGGSITLPFIKEGQYFRIAGSVFNDGLYKYGETNGLKDEVFTGTIWALSIPKDVLALADEITAWQEKNGEAAGNPYVSESFGGYTYTKATDTQTGGAVTWEKAFREQLNCWRKV
jgi:hypothetical protein